MSPREAHHHVDARRFPRVSGDEPGAGLDRGDLGAGFPRVSGDEPFADQALTLDGLFSPRERG